MPIQISTQPSIIGWDVQKAKVEQSGNAPQLLQMDSSAPVLDIQTIKPQLIIDQTESFADAGRKNLRAFMNDSVAYGRQVVSEGVMRIVDQGNTLRDIHSGGDPIPDLAIYNAYEMFEVSFNYGAIPQSRPNININKGQVNINVTRGTVENSTVDQKVQMSYSDWKIDYYMKQYSSINFRYEEPKFKFSV